MRNDIPKYRSNKSVAKNKTTPITSDDPRLGWDQIGKTKSIIGNDFDPLDENGKMLLASASQITSNQSSQPGIIEANKGIILPPHNGNPANVYDLDLIVPTDPTNVSVVWSGNDLVVTFDWDYSNPINSTVSNFIIEITGEGVTRRTAVNAFVPNRTQTQQTLTLTKQLNELVFGSFTVNISSLCVLSIDPFYNVSGTVCAPSVPTYVLNLPTPVITVTSILNGYSVAYTTPDPAIYGEIYDAIEVVEYESNATTEPTGVTYTTTFWDKINPATVVSVNTNPRWVKARFSSQAKIYTAYSAAQKVTPTNPVSVDNTPPNEVTQISAVWSGDDIIISYKLPAQDQGSRIQIQLTAPNLLVGYFYRFPDGSGRDQTTTITKKDLFDQFGEHYSFYTGLLKSVDSADNRTAGVSFNVPARSNPLTGVIPSFTLIALSNAYSATFSLPTGASYGEVYASHTDWTGNPSEDILVYSGLSPAVITDIDYTTAYVMMRYYDDFGNTSSYSAKQTITPLDPGLITSFENPISFGENAVIYAGNSPTTGTRTLFKAGGIFAYDATNYSPSTQIVSNAAAGSPTFITKQAQIADWKVSEYKIENDLSGTPTKYTGLSATGDYSFWAGSSVSGGNSSAKFTVTPLGAVTAREIYIVGTGDANSKLIDAGGSFYVKHDGSLYASAATITGNITASSGTFSGNVSIGSGGSLYSGALSGGSLSGAGYILNTSGLTFSSSTTSGITTISSATGQLTTSSALIGGWTVNSTQISKTTGGQGTIKLDSSNGYISVTNAAETAKMGGINAATSLTDSVFWIGGSNANSTTNPFRVTFGGTLYALDANITGKINANSGGFGTIVDNALTKGWTVNGDGLVATGLAKIDMGTAGAKIIMGTYSIYSDANGFKIYDGTGNIISITDNVDSSGFNRVYLGQSAGTGLTERQVEVSKNAEISGSYTGSAQDYRSGGLRNMYTITESQFTANPTAYPSAGTGSVLLVYTP